jgi:hypothetical protein
MTRMMISKDLRSKENIHTLLTYGMVDCTFKPSKLKGCKLNIPKSCKSDGSNSFWLRLKMLSKL